jgi:type IV secretion system protein VirB4
MRREREATVHIPYSAHVSDRVVRTVHGDYLQAFRLGGASFESADDEQLNGWHERLNVLWRNIAAPGVALWTHLIRRREPVTAPAGTNGGFAESLAVRYRARLARETLMSNELYLALLYRPVVGAATGLLARVMARRSAAHSALALADALDSCAKLGATVGTALERYDPEPLGTYRTDRFWCSSLLEYLALLINGEASRIPLPLGPLSDVLASTRVLFGSEAIEYRLPAATRVGAILGIKE